MKDYIYKYIEYNTKENSIFASYVCSHAPVRTPSRSSHTGTWSAHWNVERTARRARRSFLYAGMRATGRFS